MLQRLRKSSEFRSTFDQGSKVVGKFFVLFAAPQVDQTGTRVGLVVSRKVGNAVVRNYVKRRVREYFRLQHESEIPLDIVVLARHGAGEADAAMMWQELSRLVNRLHSRKLRACA